MPITNVTVNALKEYQLQQLELQEKMGSKWMNSKKVFTTNDGENMHPDTPSKILRKILNKYELPIINFHALRHTSVSHLISEGVHIQTISKRVGHSSISTTQSIYSHVFESAEREVANKMNNILSN